MGSQALYQQVRAGFVAKHTTLTAWCVKHNIHRQNAARALKGQSNGPAALALARRVAKAAGVKINKKAAAASSKPNPNPKPENPHD